MTITIVRKKLSKEYLSHTSSYSVSILKLYAAAHSGLQNTPNDANLLFGRVPSTRADNLPPISGAGGFNTTTGFGGGTANIEYQEIGTNYEVEFESTTDIYTNEYEITIQPNEYNHSMNYSLNK